MGNKKNTSIWDRAQEIPVPEVVEGNSDSDWALWEDSVSFQDSLFPPDFMDSVRVRDEAPTGNAAPSAFEQMASPDPYASVTKNRG